MTNTRRSYHVTHNNHTSSSHDTYERAVECALTDYKRAPDDVKIEVVHMSVLVWGPFVTGSRYRPTGA